MTLRRRVLQNLARALTPPKTSQHTRHKATVVTTSPLTVYLDGGSVAVPAHQLGHYTPTIGDVAMADNVAGDIVLVGKFVS